MPEARSKLRVSSRVSRYVQFWMSAEARNLSAGRPEMQAQVDGRAKWKTSENTPGTTPFPTCLLAY